MGGPEEFALARGVLYRKWREKDEGELTHIVVSHGFCEALVLLTHQGTMAGHLGVKKTMTKLLQNFSWHGLAADVATILRCCHTCQVVGKPNQHSLAAPPYHIPAGGGSSVQSGSYRHSGPPYFYRSRFQVPAGCYEYDYSLPGGNSSPEYSL